MAQQFPAYPTFQQVSAPHQSVEVPQDMAAVVGQLFQNDLFLVKAVHEVDQKMTQFFAAVHEVDQKMTQSFAAIRNDIRVLIQELDRMRAELQAVAAEVRGQKSPPPAVLPSLGPVIPQQAASDTYQPVFNR